MGDGFERAIRVIRADGDRDWQVIPTAEGDPTPPGEEVVSVPLRRRVDHAEGLEGDVEGAVARAEALGDLQRVAPDQSASRFSHRSQPRKIRIPTHS